jgi:hypothetical protein
VTRAVGSVAVLVVAILVVFGCSDETASKPSPVVETPPPVVEEPAPVVEEPPPIIAWDSPGAGAPDPFEIEPDQADLLAAASLETLDLTEALRNLKIAAKPLPTNDQQASRVLRLAVMRLLNGDLEGYVRECRRLPRNTAARRLADRLGAPKTKGADLVRRAPNEAATVPATVSQIDLIESMPFAVDRLVILPEGTGIRRAIVRGYIRGLDAFVTEGDEVLIPGDEVQAGLLWPLTGEPDVEGEEGNLLASALEHLAAGREQPALEAAIKVQDHPVARAILTKAALSRGPGSLAKRAILAEEEAPPPGPAFGLLFAEALLANGEIGRASKVVHDLEPWTGDLSARPFVRRTRAMLKMTADDDSETVAELDALIRDHPEDRAAFEDLAGLHLAAGRYGKARTVLVALAVHHAKFAKKLKYIEARKKAAAGIVRTAKRAADLRQLDGTDDDDIRKAAVQSVPGLRIAEQDRAYLHFLSDENRGVRVYAVRGLTRLGLKKNVPAIRALLTDEDPLVRGSAVHALANLAGKAAAADLAECLSDDAEYVRQLAVTALRKFAGRRFAYDPAADAAARARPTERWKEWAKTETTSPANEER